MCHHLEKDDADRQELLANVELILCDPDVSKEVIGQCVSSDMGMGRVLVHR